MSARSNYDTILLIGQLIAELNHADVLIADAIKNCT